VSTRIGSCRCGQLKAECAGEPVRISVCHCLACQQRTGSAVSAQARWPEDQVTVKGRSTSWIRTADSGRQISYNFCPDCGSTVHYTGGNFPGLVAVPVGAFADPDFPPPQYSVWEARKHEWVEIRGPNVEHSS
jgi:hypothetical protein